MDKKRCSHCGSDELLDNFPRAGSRGRGSWCRPCARAANREWKDRNREQVNASKRAARAREKAERPTLQSLAARVIALEEKLADD